MKKELVYFLILFISIFALYYRVLGYFFAQDDFMLLSHFSRSTFAVDLYRVFGPAQVSHWRPLHNLYFMVSGILFYKNYQLYHLLNIIILATSSYYVFKVIDNVVRQKFSAILAGLIYGLHPAHFMSIAWISGNATLIGFLFLIISIYLSTKNNKGLSIFAFLLAMSASEAMLAGLPLVFCYAALKKKSFKKRGVIVFLLVTIAFLILKIATILAVKTLDTYKLRLSLETIKALKYYAFRILGFGETSHDLIISILLTVWLVTVGYFVLINRQKERKWIYLGIISALLGLFPFILLPSHLSPNYMNISVFGYTLICAIAIKNLNSMVKFTIILTFVLISINITNLSMKYNWVYPRSELAKKSLMTIEEDKLANNSTIIIGDSRTISSQEMYFSLGGGEAIEFWYPDRHYNICFSTFVQKCSLN